MLVFWPDPLVGIDVLGTGGLVGVGGPATMNERSFAKTVRSNRLTVGGQVGNSMRFLRGKVQNLRSTLWLGSGPTTFYSDDEKYSVSLEVERAITNYRRGKILSEKNSYR